MYKGGLLDVDKLMSQLKRSEKARTDTEQKMISLKQELTSVKDTATKSASTVKDLTSELRDIKEKLQLTEQNLAEAKVSFEKIRSSVFHMSTHFNIKGEWRLKKWSIL